MSTDPTAPAAPAAETDDGYPALEALVRARVAVAAGPLFSTDADQLWDAYLGNIPAVRRQHYNCRRCRRFIERFGGLVTTDAEGRTAPLLWEPGADVPALFASTVAALAGRVAQASVTGVFLSADAAWGTPASPKGWTHLSGSPPAAFADKLKTAGQATAERAEEFGMLGRALAEYPLAVAEQAARVLAADALTRSEKAQAVADWFLALHRRVEGVRGPRRDNLVWAAVAVAPPGFCHVRSTVLSTLLDDIVAGLEFDAIRARWAEKLHPLQYQRPTAAPTRGAIDAAEKLFTALGAAASLARRYARLADVSDFLWRPREEAPTPAAGGLFGHLRAVPAGVKAVELPAIRITWERFARAVLPGALELEARVPPSGNFYGLLTAADPAAPAIFQWDGLPGRARNPASMYVYVNGSAAERWGLAGGSWVEVTGVFRNPAHWQAPELFRHQGEQALFALRGARDASDSESCLFPECLRGEFRVVRSVVEAHSKRTAPAGAAEGDANGIGFGKGAQTPLSLRVRTAAGVAVYELDRWD